MAEGHVPVGYGSAMERQFKQLFEDYFKEKRRKLSKLKGSCQSWNVVVVNCSLIHSVRLTSYVDKWPFLFMSESSYSQNISLRHRFACIFLGWNCLSTKLWRDSRNSAVSQFFLQFFNSLPTNLSSKMATKIKSIKIKTIDNINYQFQ